MGERASDERRARRAVRNRAHIVESGKQLFLHQGYFAVTVEEIADAADVSPATVYSTAGGKTGILHALMSEWEHSPALPAAATQLQDCTTASAVVQLIAASSREVREAHGDVMQIMIAIAPHDETIAAEFDTATRRYQNALHSAAEQLVKIKAIRANQLQITSDIFWFYFGYAGWFTLIRDLHWPLAQAEEWLTGRAVSYIEEMTGAS